MNLVRNIEKLVRIEFAVNNGYYHQAYNPKGLTELNPGLNPTWFATSEHGYKILKDSRVHRILHGQFEYLQGGPADMG